MKADHSLLGPRCIIKIHRADILPLSEWNYLRPIQSKFDICPLFKYIFEQDNKFFKYSNFQGSKPIKLVFDEKSDMENFISFKSADLLKSVTVVTSATTNVTDFSIS